MFKNVCMCTDHVGLHISQAKNASHNGIRWRERGREAYVHNATQTDTGSQTNWQTDSW